MSESTLDNFEINIKDDIKIGVMDEPFKVYIEHFKDIEDSYGTVEKLIEAYLARIIHKKGSELRKGLYYIVVSKKTPKP